MFIFLYYSIFGLHEVHQTSIGTPLNSFFNTNHNHRHSRQCRQLKHNKDHFHKKSSEKYQVYEKTEAQQADCISA